MRLLDLYLAPLAHRALDHRRENAPPKIRTECSPVPVPPSMKWSAFDENTYDADCDQDGFFSRSPVGHGPTREAAIADLLEQLEVSA